MMPLSRQTSTTLNILDLNDDVFEEILSYLPFDDIAKIRLVCCRFDHTSKSLLNKGALSLRLYITKCEKEMEAKRPRRDTEITDEAHQLFEQMDVLNRMRTVLFLLSNIYNRHYYVFPSSAGLKTCFIPGKYLDECYRILKLVKTNQPSTLNCYDFTKELEKIHIKAATHFREHILRPFKIKQEFVKFILGISVPNTSCSLTVPSSELELEHHLVSIDNLRKKNSELKSKVLALEKLLNEHERKWILLGQHLGQDLGMSRYRE